MYINSTSRKRIKHPGSELIRQKPEYLRPAIGDVIASHAHSVLLAQFVDAAAAAFRFIDHTSFDRYAAGVLHALDCASPGRLFDLIRL